jgi:predicted nucleotidyltransferase component of viral defense system
LAIAEKDYFLALVSQIVFNSPLREKIVFKGGTAIHHCYLDQFRFSEDLDFGSLDKKITPEDVKAVFEPYDFLSMKKEYTSAATIKLEKLLYFGPLGLPNSLKVEIDRLQEMVLPPQDLEYRNVWKVDTKVRVMDIREICAEKIRAVSDRARYRDFYDLFLIIEKYAFDMEEILFLVSQKEIRKPITKKSILANWSLVQENKESEARIIYYFRPIEGKKVKAMLDNLPFEEIPNPRVVESRK